MTINRVHHDVMNVARDHDFVPALWAERRVAMLLDAIRLNGRRRELVDEVRRLGREFGVVTPFTSHLIVEEVQRLGGGPMPSATERPPIRYRGPGSVVPPWRRGTSSTAASNRSSAART